MLVLHCPQTGSCAQNLSPYFCLTMASPPQGPWQLVRRSPKGVRVQRSPVGATVRLLLPAAAPPAPICFSSVDEESRGCGTGLGVLLCKRDPTG